MYGALKIKVCTIVVNVFVLYLPDASRFIMPASANVPKLSAGGLYACV